MGCDGGTIPRRDELVRMKKKPEQKEKEAELHCLWRLCALSQEPLQKPIVACELGRLYNKDAVIEALLDKSILPHWASHLSTLRDVRTLNLVPNPAFKQTASQAADTTQSAAPYICPVIGQEMNGRFPFVFIWSCGCVVSQRALKEVKTTNCHACQASFAPEDVVILNPSTEADVALMTERMEERRARAKAAKKSKKSKKEKKEVIANGTNEANGIEKDDGKVAVKQEAPADSTSEANGVEKDEEKVAVKRDAPADGTSEANGVEKDEGKVAVKREAPADGTEGPSKKGKSADGKGKSSTNARTGPAPPGSKPNGTVAPKIARDVKPASDYSVSQDPKASEVYKSIFTSHDSAATQQKAHWITYNPFYN